MITAQEAKELTTKHRLALIGAPLSAIIADAAKEGRSLVFVAEPLKASVLGALVAAGFVVESSNGRGHGEAGNNGGTVIRW